MTTTGGAAVITMDRGQATGLVQHANGTVWNVTKEYKSGFFSSWNKVGGGGMVRRVWSGPSGWSAQSVAMQQRAARLAGHACSWRPSLVGCWGLGYAWHTAWGL